MSSFGMFIVCIYDSHQRLVLAYAVNQYASFRTSSMLTYIAKLNYFSLIVTKDE